MKRIACVYFVFASALAAAQVPAGFSQLDVPATVSVKQEIAATPPNWQAGRDAARPELKAVTVFDGAPSEEAALVPDREVKAGAYAVWTFDPKGKRLIWVQAQFAGTAITLAQALPAGTKELRVYFDKGASVDGARPIKRVVYR